MVAVVHEPADLDAVVSEDAVAAPDLGAAHTVHEAAVPAVAALQSGDAALRTCAPFDELAEPGPAFDRLAGGALASLGARWPRGGHPGPAGRHPLWPRRSRDRR